MLDKATLAGPLVTVEAAMIGLPGTGTAIGPYTLDLPRAEITSLVGPSGSGKTTLVRAIVERRPPVAGQIDSGRSRRSRLRSPERLGPPERHGVGAAAHA